MRISYDLNAKEKEVHARFPKPGEHISIEDLAAVAFPKKGTSAKTKGNSWVRNSLRKLVRLGLVKGKGKKSGLYTRTEMTLSDLAEAKRKHEEAKAAKAAKKVKAAKKPKSAKTPKAA